MKRVLVVSDTHIPVAASTLPSQILKEAEQSDLCLHAGDLIDYGVFTQLSKLTNVYAVCGNMDTEEVRRKLPPQQIVEIEGIKIALIHGRGAPYDLINLVNRIFQKEIANIDIFIFGHSHQPLDKVLKGKIYFNPGSPTDKIFAPYNSYGILEIENNKVERRLITLG